MEASLYLADINNERSDKTPSYAENLNKLDKLVLVRFTDDQTGTYPWLDLPSSWWCLLPSRPGIPDGSYYSHSGAAVCCLLALIGFPLGRAPPKLTLSAFLPS